MNNLRKFLRIGAILSMLTFAATAVPVSAQSNNMSSGNRTTERNDGTDWSWMGLIGLLGLAGLVPRKRTVDHDNSRNDRV